MTAFSPILLFVTNSVLMYVIRKPKDIIFCPVAVASNDVFMLRPEPICLTILSTVYSCAQCLPFACSALSESARFLIDFCWGVFEWSVLLLGTVFYLTLWRPRCAKLPSVL